MDNYAILKITKFHTHKQISMQQAHNNREYEMSHVDAAKSIQNVILVDRGINYNESWHQRYEQANIERDVFNKKPRSNAVLAVELMMSFSRGSNVDIKQWSAENVKWLNDTFGEDNVISCTLHMDEEVPHIHATVIPIDKEGKLNAKEVIGGPSGLYKMQNSYGEAMKQFGLIRGEKRSKAKAKSIDQFYRSVNIIDNEPAPSRADGENDKEYIDRLTDYCYNLKLAYENMKRKAQRTKEIIDTRIGEAFREYKKAVNLQNLVFSHMNGDKEKTLKRMDDYIYLEQAVPPDKLDVLLKSLRERFVIDEDKMKEEMDKEIKEHYKEK